MKYAKSIFSMRTEHLNRLEHPPESYDLQLLGAPENTKNTQEMSKGEFVYSTSPAVLCVKYAKSIFSMRTEHLNRLEHPSESYNLQLSEAF
jgi:hypothetical protein